MSDDAKSLLVEYARTNAGSRTGQTLGALTRSDRDRLHYWPGSNVVHHAVVEGMDRPGEVEAVVISAAERFSEMRACVGFVITDDFEASPSVWLVLNGTAVIDPARSRRTLLGCLGVELRHTERANWSASQPHLVAERDVHRLRVAL